MRKAPRKTATASAEVFDLVVSFEGQRRRVATDVEVFDPGEGTGPVLRCFGCHDGDGDRLAPWRIVRRAGSELAQIAVSDTARVVMRTSDYVRRFGLLLGGLNERNPLNGERVNLGYMSAFVDWSLDTFERRHTLAALLPELRRERRAPGRRPVASALIKFDPDNALFIDASEEREAEILHGPTWSGYGSLLQRLQNFAAWVGTQPDANPEVGYLEPLALYEVLGRAINDALQPRPLIRTVEAGHRILQSVLTSQTVPNLAVYTDGSSVGGVRLRVSAQSWLGLVTMAAVAGGTPNLRRCEYRNCGAWFEPSRRDARFCSSQCGNSERTYRSRERTR